VTVGTAPGPSPGASSERHFAGFGADAHIRLSYAASMDNIKTGIARIAGVATIVGGRGFLLGDDGSGASDECPAGNSAPFCAASGTCGQCSNDTDCTTGAHAGPACNTATGECVSVAEPDGGAPADAGTPQSQDAETPQQDAAGASPPNNISIKGGGCACGTLAGHGGEGGSAAILIVLVAALGAWLARRRARRVSF